MNVTLSINELFQQMEWADAAVWAVVLGSPQAASDDVLQHRLQHIHLVQHAFLQTWKQEPFDPRDATFEDSVKLAGWAREYYSGLHAYLEGLNETSQDRPIVVPWAAMVEEKYGGPVGVPTLKETMMQVATHSAYHRGQVNSRLRELGCEPPLTDFIGWIWFGKPGPEWPEAAGAA